MKFKTILVLILLALIVGVSAGGYIAVSRGVPSIEELKHFKDVPPTKVYADDDTLIGEIKLEKGIYVTLDKIPGSLINAVLAIEDANFWKHKGVDYFAILRAAYKDILHRHLKEGGSTITQQLAKMTFLTPEKTAKRKLKEMFLATKMESELTKQEILELYLNRVYLGHGAYGVEMAANVYFGKSVKDLNLPESCLIAGLLKAPGSYSPFKNIRRAKERQGLVLARMEDVGFISKKEKEDADKTAVNLSTGGRESETYNYFLDYIRKQLESKYGTETIYKGGLKVYTSMSKDSQISAQRAVGQGLRELDKRRGWRGPMDKRNDVEKLIKLYETGKTSDITGFQKKNPGAGDIADGIVLRVNPLEATLLVRGVIGRLSVQDSQWASVTVDSKKKKPGEKFSLLKILAPGDVILVGIKSVKGNMLELVLEQEPEIQAALVAVDPNTGYIKALVGGYDYTKSEFNRAISGFRQAGSAFKPVTYTVALDSGYSPATIVQDLPTSFEGGRGLPDWVPHNYDGDFYGNLSLRDALAYSRNVVTARIVNDVGVDKVINFARELGVTAQMPRDLTLALGSLSISPLELTLCYSVFANEGVRMEPIAIKYITDYKARVIESNEPAGEELISSETAFLITSMMKDVIRYGTGQRAKAVGRPVAGKTGTSNDYRDAWFLGYTPDLVAGVWVGFDDMAKSLGSGESGGRAATPIWTYFMQSALKEYEPRDFDMPDDIVPVWIDPTTGLATDPSDKNGQTDYFKLGQEPKKP